MMILNQRLGYSRAEEISDAVIHVSGVSTALIAVPVLVTLAVVLRGDIPAIAGTGIYGAALIAMLLCSALYNMTRETRRKAFFRHLDQTAIFIKIASTYTPFVLLSGAGGSWLLPGLWGAALAGSVMRLIAPDRLRLAAVALALAMGWAGLFAGSNFFGGLSTAVIVLIVIGGLLYTVGVAFFLFERLPFHYTIWHVFVLAASMVFYAAVTVQMVQSSV
jgi:hemolysin III